MTRFFTTTASAAATTTTTTRRTTASMVAAVAMLTFLLLDTGTHAFTTTSHSSYSSFSSSSFLSTISHQQQQHHSSPHASFLSTSTRAATKTTTPATARPRPATTTTTSLSASLAQEEGIGGVDMALDTVVLNFDKQVDHAMTTASTLLATVVDTTTTFVVSELQLPLLLSTLLTQPVFWSCVVMLSIVALLFSWETTVATARQSLPETLQPAVDGMLVEMGGLGFVGLILSIVVVDGPVNDLLNVWSQTFLGNEQNILWQSYQYLDSAFFEVAICYFVICSVTVATTAKQVESIELVSQAAFDVNGDGVVELHEIAQVLNVDSIAVDLNGDGDLDDDEISAALDSVPRQSLWKELFRTEKVAQAETLVVRERLIQQNELSIGGGDAEFQLERYFSKVFGRNLSKMVELSPLTWLPLIPVVAQGRSIDLSQGIVSASSPDAFVNCGQFLSNPGYLAVSSVFCGAAAVWGVWNFWKMVQIKQMLVPTLVRDAAAAEEALLLPPRYDLNKQLDAFSSSPFPFNVVESIWGQPARNRQEALFGAAGRKGPSLYRNSIKLHTWFVVAQLVFYASQIVLRDATALMEGALQVSGRETLVELELAVYGFYCCLAVGQLWLVPKTFLDYSLVTSIEKLVSAEYLSEACVLDGVCPPVPEQPEIVMTAAATTTTTFTTTDPTIAGGDGNAATAPSLAANATTTTTKTATTTGAGTLSS